MKNRLVATVILMVAMFMDLMDSTITTVALPAIGDDIGATPAQLEWTLAGYVVAFATLLITGGRLGDIVGRRRVFVIGVVGFTAASALASFALSGDALVATRVLQGAFAGVMVPPVLSTLQVLFAPNERGAVFGIVGALSALGAICGLLVGGALVTANAFDAGWRSIFLINVPIGVLLVVMALLVVPASRSSEPVRLDPLGVVLGATSVFLVVFPLTAGRQAGWAWWVWALLAAAPCAFALFVAQQRRRDARDHSALLPLALFRIPGFSRGLLVQVLSSVGNGSYALVLLYYVQEALGFSPIGAGLTILPLAIGSMIATPAAMALAKALGRRAVVLGGSLQAAAFGWVALTIALSGDTLSGWQLAPALALAGAGMMTLVMPQMQVTLADVPTEAAGAASGALTTIGQTGMALGIAVAGSAYFGINGSDPLRAVVTGLAVTIGAYAAAAVSGALLPRPARVYA